MSQILKNLPVGSYAVVFPSISSGVDEEGHEKLLAELYRRVQETEGFLGLESASSSPFKLAVAYFDSLEFIDAWRRNSEHIAAKNKARSTWLDDWQIRICKIEDIFGKQSNDYRKNAVNQQGDCHAGCFIVHKPRNNPVVSSQKPRLPGVSL